MKLQNGDTVNTSLRLLAVDGEVPPGSGEQSINKTVVVGNFYKEPINNFIVGEVSNFTSKEKQNL